MCYGKRYNVDFLKKEFSKWCDFYKLLVIFKINEQTREILDYLEEEDNIIILFKSDKFHDIFIQYFQIAEYIICRC